MKGATAVVSSARSILWASSQAVVVAPRTASAQGVRCFSQQIALRNDDSSSSNLPPPPRFDPSKSRISDSASPLPSAPPTTDTAPASSADASVASGASRPPYRPYGLLTNIYGLPGESNTDRTARLRNASANSSFGRAAATTLGDKQGRMAALASQTSMLDIFKTGVNPSTPFPESNSHSGGFQGLDMLTEQTEPYHMHVYSHRHNTHVTVTKPNRDAIVSLSCGNIGFRKSRRKNFDAAYQLTAHVLSRLNHAGWNKKIQKLEVVLRGFGQGREASMKVLMSMEGSEWRKKVIRVADSTRLKFGGTRSKKPRRL